jgi:hypothetical protein
MNRTLKWAIALSVSFGFAAAQPALAQGKGKDGGKPDHAQAAKGHDKGSVHKVSNQQGKSDQGKGKPDHAGKQAKPDNPGQAKANDRDNKGNSPGKAANGAKWENKGGSNSGKFTRRFDSRDVRPDLKRYFTSNSTPQRYAAGAIVRANARGANDDLFVLTPSGNSIRVANRSGALLFDLDEDRARKLGAWDVRRVDERDSGNAPAFCRSGAGHPNWGRQWCIDKGFGLGNSNDIRWGRATTVGDIIFGRSLSAGELARAALISAIGDIAFNRLALHSVSLGYSEPLTGVYYTDPNGMRLMRVNSGVYPVAEIVDSNTDDRADVLVVALKPW